MNCIDSLTVLWASPYGKPTLPRSRSPRPVAADCHFAAWLTPRPPA